MYVAQDDPLWKPSFSAPKYKPSVDGATGN